MTLATLLQCCIVIVMQIKLTVGVVKKEIEAVQHCKRLLWKGSAVTCN